MKRGREVADAVKQHRHDQEVFAFARVLSDNVIGPLDGGDLSSSGSRSKSRRLSFKGLGTKSPPRCSDRTDRRHWLPVAPPLSATDDVKPEPPAITQRDGGVLIQGARRPRHTVQGTFHLMWE